MVESGRISRQNGASGQDVWVDAMRQAGLSKRDISRVIEATATLAHPENGHGELVPVKEAARRIGRSENTVRSWIRLGHLATIEIPPPPDHANGPWVHVNMGDVETMNEKNTHKDALMTLREAAERYAITLGRLRGWVYVGHLQPRSRRADGAFLVAPADVDELLKDPPRTGRPRKAQQA